MTRIRAIAALSNWLAFAATLAVAFALTPFLIAKLGTERYDVWCLAEAVLAYFTLLDMGLAACLVRGVARHHATRDALSLNRMASACLALFSVAGLAAFVIGVPVMLGLASRYHSDDVTGFLLVMVLNLAITLPLSLFPSTLDGLERYTVKSLIKIVSLAVRTTVTVLLVNREAALMPLAIAFTILNLLEHAMMAGLAFRLLPELRFRRSLLTREAFREIWQFSLDAFLAMVAGRITVQTGVIVVGLLMAPGAVTIFVTASRLVDYSKTLLRTITATLTPGVSALEARGDYDGIRRLCLGATRLVLYLTLPIQLGLWFFGTPFLVRWVPVVGANGTTPLMILAVTLTLSVAQSVASRMLYGLGKLRVFARLTLLEAVLNLFLLVLLIPDFELTGVAIGLAVPNVLVSILIIRHTLRILEVHVITYLVTWKAPLATALIPIVIWSAIGTVEARWDAIISSILAGLVPYALCVVALECNAPLILRRQLQALHFSVRRSHSGQVRT